VLIDDPLLTVREVVRSRPLVRAVFDRRLRTPPTARLFTTLSDGPVIILTSAAAIADAPARVSALTAAGACVVAGADDIAGAIRGLLAFGVSSVLVEGGAAVYRALLDADLVDTAHVIVSPVTLGIEGVPAFGGGQVGLTGVPRSVEWLGPDKWMEFDVHGNR
jgi:diaminohydroxyphosphoribosylaminopyrimidine deaminase/5-amino-6-(5-phosphoribosylamino)uracil reductase